jgi:hypothetical protein
MQAILDTAAQEKNTSLTHNDFFSTHSATQVSFNYLDAFSDSVEHYTWYL